MALDKLVYHPVYVVFVICALIINFYMITHRSVFLGIALAIMQVPWFARGIGDGLFKKGWNKFYRHVNY